MDVIQLINLVLFNIIISEESFEIIYELKKRVCYLLMSLLFQ